MNKKIKLILALVLTVCIVAGAVIAYNTLKDSYTQSSPATEQTSKLKAPDFTVYNRDGIPVKLSSFTGKPIVLNFWASWCYYCGEEMPAFNKSYKENPDIEFMMVNVTDGYQETLEIAKKYIRSNGYVFPVYYDTELEAASLYGASSLPLTFFIDKEGYLVSYASGMLNEEQLAQRLSLLK